MKSLLLFAISMIILDGVAEAQSLRGKRLLVFSKTTGFRHASIADGKKMILEVAQQESFRVDTTEDAAVFTDNKLRNYDAIVFLSTTGNILDSSQKSAFQRFVRAGKGFMGIHSATNTEEEWPWYNQLVGAYFKDHPAPQNATYINLDKKHPATAFWPEKFSRFEEIYNFKSLQRDKLSFVLKVDEQSYNGGSMPDFHPMAWCQIFEGGKSFYTALGHHPETFADPDFRKHIIGGLRWLVAK